MDGKIPVKWIFMCGKRFASEAAINAFISLK
jgi:hypothetical protein